MGCWTLKVGGVFHSLGRFALDCHLRQRRHEFSCFLPHLVMTRLGATRPAVVSSVAPVRLEVFSIIEALLGLLRELDINDARGLNPDEYQRALATTAEVHFRNQLVPVGGTLAVLEPFVFARIVGPMSD